MAKQLGRGSKLYRGDIASATNFVQVPQVENIGEIGQESSEVEVTDLDSTAREYLAALPDTSDIAAQILWDPLNAVHQNLNTDQELGTVRYFKIEVYRGTPLVLIRTLTFQAFVKRFGKGPFENQTPLRAPISLRRSGSVVES
jgi:hypothetical protein